MYSAGDHYAGNKRGKNIRLYQAYFAGSTVGPSKPVRSDRNPAYWLNRFSVLNYRVHSIKSNQLSWSTRQKSLEDAETTRNFLTTNLNEQEIRESTSELCTLTVSVTSVSTLFWPNFGSPLSRFWDHLLSERSMLIHQQSALLLEYINAAL